MAPTAHGRSQSPPYQSPSPPQSDSPTSTDPATDRRGKRWSSEEEQEVLAVTARFLGAGKTSDWNRVKSELQGPAKLRSLTAIKDKYKKLVPQPNAKKKKELRKVVSDLSVESSESSSQDGDSQETLSNVGSPPLASPSLHLPAINPGSPLRSPPVASNALHSDSYPVFSSAPVQDQPPSPIDWTLAEDAALLTTLYIPSQSVKSWEEVRDVTVRTYRIAEGRQFDKTFQQCAERYYLALKELRFGGQDFAYETIQAILYTNFHREQIARYAPATLSSQVPQATAPPSRTYTPVLPAPQINRPTYITSQPLLDQEMTSRRHSNNAQSLNKALFEASVSHGQSHSASSIPQNFPHQLVSSPFAYNEHIPNYRSAPQSLVSNQPFSPPAESHEPSSQTQQKPVLLPFSPISPELYRATWTNRKPSPSSTENFDDRSTIETPETVITRPSPRSKARDLNGSPEPVEGEGTLERGMRRGRKRGSSAISYKEVTELSDNEEEYRDVAYTKKVKVE
ncbi:hypothetical protein JCM5353_005486 [Sporobolomyces roseus]